MTKVSAHIKIKVKKKEVLDHVEKAHTHFNVGFSNWIQWNNRIEKSPEEQRQPKTQHKKGFTPIIAFRMEI